MPYVQNGSYLKLREVNLSYNLPEQSTSRLFGGGVRYARLSLTGRNLLRVHALSRARPGGEQLRQPSDRAEHRCGSLPAESQLLLLDRLGVLTMTPTNFSRLLPVARRWSEPARCDYDIANPNSPAVIGENPSAAQVGAAANGILIATRQDVADWALDGAIFGREAYRIDPADPRFVQEMMQGPSTREAAPSAATTGWSRIRPSAVPTTSWRLSALPARSPPSSRARPAALPTRCRRTTSSSSWLPIPRIRSRSMSAAMPAHPRLRFVTNAEAWNHVIALLDQAATELVGSRVSLYPARRVHRLQHSGNVPPVQSRLAGTGRGLPRRFRRRTHLPGPIVPRSRGFRSDRGVHGLRHRRR